MNILGFAMRNGAEGDVRIYFFEKRSMVLVEIEYAQMSCAVSLSKTHLSLLSTGSTQEDPSRHN